ncbi:MAG TPA: peptidase M16, partial [Alteromonas sp.]|nr:peptidase M16 [Alteromonas sp.]
MKKLLIAGVVSAALLGGCATEKAQAPASPVATPESVMVSPNDDRQYDTFTLPNQLEVMLVSDPAAEKSAASLSVSVGLLHDPMSQQGMAHYLEHMLFLGTERYPDTKGYTEFMTANGGQHNAYTWLDITNYMFKINNDAYGEALDRFSDFFKAPKLYPEYTDKEKNAVNAEWSMRREMDYFGQFKLARSLMGDHPANRFLIGNLETLGDKEGSKLHTETVNFYERYYSANIMKLAMISNRPLDEMKALAEEYFGNIENKNIDNPTVDDKLDFAKVGGKRIH